MLQMCCPSEPESPLSITPGLHQDLEFATCFKRIADLRSKHEVPPVPLPISIAGTYPRKGQQRQQVPCFLKELRRNDAPPSHPEGKPRSFQRQDIQHAAPGTASNNLGRALGSGTPVALLKPGLGPGLG